MFKDIDGGVCAPLGFQASGIHCGIRKNKSKKDLSLIVSDVMCHCASTYTQNKVKGAPIYVTQQHLKNLEAKAIICNSGNANTCNPNGKEIADKICQLCGQALGIDSDDIVVASTGVIGQPLSIEPFENHMEQLVQSLSIQGSSDACEGIMTTDTVKKEYAVELKIGDKICHIGAIAKGSGMIHPNMATMLAFVTSDVAINKEMLNEVIHEVVDDTFNMVSVDGDTSTNDMLTLMCNGLAQNQEITQKDENYYVFKEALMYICTKLSKAIAKDGEGATKLLTCTVLHGQTLKDAKVVAKSVITSSLFKAAMFGQDANWGRILCAIGYSPARYDIQKIDVDLKSIKGKIRVCENGGGYPFSEEKAAQILSEDEIEVIVDLHDGEFEAVAWGCDLTYDYVKINGDYRT